MFVRIGDEVFEDKDGQRKLFATWTHGAWYREASRTANVVEWDVVSVEDAVRCESAVRLDDSA